MPDPTTLTEAQLNMLATIKDGIAQAFLDAADQFARLHGPWVEALAAEMARRDVDF